MQKFLYKVVPSDIDRNYFDALCFKICCRKTEKSDAIELFLHVSQNITLACSVHYNEN